MIRTYLAIVCEGVSIDVTTGQVSIYSLLESVPVQNMPAFFPPLSFLAILTREPNDPSGPAATLNVSLGGAHVLSAPVIVDFKNQFRTRVTVRVNGLVVTTPGVLRFSLSILGDEVATRSVAVEMAPATAAQGAVIV
jgi:hypothetical protein